MARSVILGREQPADTTGTVVYTTPDNGVGAIVRFIHVTKVIDAAAEFSVYLNAAGSYVSSNSIFYRNPVGTGRQTVQIDFGPNGLGMNDLGDTISVQSHTAEAFTFTVHGEVDR